MPRGSNFRGRPVNLNKSSFIANSSTTIEDDLLKARMKNRGDRVKITQEHYAAYYAFAGITDRRTVVKLMHGNVSFDDVNDYSGTGLVHHEAYDKMIDLREKGFTPQIISSLKEICYSHQMEEAFTFSNFATIASFDINHIPDIADSADRYFSTFSAALQYAGILDNNRKSILHWTIGGLALGISSEEMSNYVLAAVRNINEIAKFHNIGISGDDCRLRAYLDKSASINSSQAIRLYAATKNREIIRAMFIVNENRKEEVKRWEQSGIDPEMIPMLYQAGFTGDDVLSSPHLKDFDKEALRTFISLRS